MIISSAHRRIDMCLVVVLLGVVYGMNAHIVPSDEVRPLSYTERVYLLALVLSGALLVGGYVYKWAGAASAANSLAFYTLFLAAVAPRHSFLTAADGSTHVVIPFYHLWIALASVAYVLASIWQGRFPILGEFLLKTNDPAVAFHRAQESASEFLDLTHLYHASNYARDGADGRRDYDGYAALPSSYQQQQQQQQHQSQYAPYVSDLRSRAATTTMGPADHSIASSVDER